LQQITCNEQEKLPRVMRALKSAAVRRPLSQQHETNIAGAYRELQTCGKTAKTPQNAVAKNSKLENTRKGMEPEPTLGASVPVNFTPPKWRGLASGLVVPDAYSLSSLAR
jgi:hypothetical protein